MSTPALVRTGLARRRRMYPALKEAKPAGSWAAHLRRGEDGNAILELAFLLPVMMAVITGLFSFGIALNAQLELTQSVGAGGQFLQQIRSTTTDPCKDLSAAVQANATNLKPAQLNLTLTMTDSSGSSTVDTGMASTFSCAGDQSHLVSGGTATVSGTYPCNLFVYGLNLGNSCQLSAQVAEFEY